MNNLHQIVTPAIYTEYYSHENSMCYKIDLPYSQYAKEKNVLCKVSEGIELARKIALEMLTKRIEEAVFLELEN